MQLQTKNLTIKVAGLFSEGLNFAAPQKTSQSSELIAKYNEWTEKPTSPIFSGYKLRSQEKYFLAESVALAKELKKDFKNALILGIGGSALGAKCALNALSWRASAQDIRRVDIIDNLDPLFFELAVNSINMDETLVVVVTKTGGTLETISQLTILKNRFFQDPQKLKKHLLCVTDPEAGALRKFAQKNDLRTLPVPSDVGGRFSVLTPVGSFALEFAGIDCEALLQGANDFFSHSERLPFLAKMSQRLVELDEANFSNHVLMPYSTLLKGTGEWFVQLWGESLGKKHSKGFYTGPAPMAAVGATDQHSLLQLLVGGSAHFVTGLLSINHWPKAHDPIIENIPEEFSSLKFAESKRMSQILNAEKMATAQVLQNLNRPTYEIVLREQNEQALGELFACYMDLVVLSAACYQINPFDQPGVELGKQLMPKILDSI